MKQALDLDQQVDRLIERGMTVPDRDFAKNYLHKTGYHRLSLYWSRYQPGLATGDKSFVANLTFQRIVDVYDFDAKLRRILLHGVAEFEPFFKATFGTAIASRLGREGYLDAANFRDPGKHSATCNLIKDDLVSSKEPDVEKFRSAFPGLDAPVWMAFEVASFGRISSLFGNVRDPKLMKDASAPWGLNQTKLPGVVQGVSLLRNTLAHHGKLWGRNSSVRGAAFEYPLRLRNAQSGVDNRTTYWWAAMLAHLVESGTPGSSFRDELNSHLASNKTMWMGLGIPDARDPQRII